MASSIPSPNTIQHHRVAGGQGGSFQSGLMEEASRHGPIAQASPTSRKGLGEVTRQQQEECWVRIRHAQWRNPGLRDRAEGCSEADWRRHEGRQTREAWPLARQGLPDLSSNGAWQLSADAGSQPASRGLLLSGRDSKRQSPNRKGQLDHKAPSCASLPSQNTGAMAGTPFSCIALTPSLVPPLKTGGNSHTDGSQPSGSPPEVDLSELQPSITSAQRGHAGSLYAPVLFRTSTALTSPRTQRPTSNLAVGTSTLPTPSPPIDYLLVASLPSLELLLTQRQPAGILCRATIFVHPPSLL